MNALSVLVAEDTSETSSTSFQPSLNPRYQKPASRLHSSSPTQERDLNPLKEARTSRTNISGCSKAAKCPPFSSSLK